MKTNKILFGLIFICIIVLFTGCVAGHNPAAHTANEVGQIAGFWSGLWHGMIAPFMFIVSLFSDNVHFYEAHNNGGWYNFGFLIGIGALFGSRSKIDNRP